MNTENTTAPEFEIVTNSALEAITRGEIDMQIATAHKFPRSMEKFKQRAVAMATLDEETAGSCLYARPVGKDPDTGKQKIAEGMSIRMAEIVGACYGNLRVGAMIISQTERQVVCRGFAHDLESNFASTSEVVEATVKRNGQPYDERMRVVIAKACLSKARRDATFQVVPKALAKPIEAACKRIVAGEGTTHEKRKEGWVNWITKLGIDKARVWDALDISGPADLSMEKIAILAGLSTAIKDGETTIDEAFPPTIAKVAAPPSKPAGDAKRATTKAKPSEPTGEQTPAQKVRVLLANIGSGEEELLAYCKSEGQCEPTVEGLDDLGDPLLQSIINSFIDIAPLLKKATEEAPQPPAVVIPDDPAELLNLAIETVGTNDLDEKDALAAMKRLKFCGVGLKNLSEVARSGLVKLIERIDDVKTEIARHAAE
jgi:hypothetical protein